MQMKAPRFAFGRNWLRYLTVVTPDRISQAEVSLRQFIGADRFAGASFLDVGSGSGLFSLAALRLGASRVHSFDFDPVSVACAEALREQFGYSQAQWTIQRASVLDADYIKSLGRW